MFLKIWCHKRNQRKLLNEFLLQEESLLEGAKVVSSLCFGELKEKFKHFLTKRLQNLREYYILFKGLELETINEYQRNKRSLEKRL